MARLAVAVIAAACCTSVACASPAQAPPPAAPTSPPPTSPAPALADWADGYCKAVKDLTTEVYTLPKPFDIKTAADLPRVETALSTLDAKLSNAITGLENLPDLAPPAQEANAVVSDRLAHYRDLRGQVVEYLVVLHRGGVDYAQSALTVLGIDMVAYKPAAYASDVPGMREVMKANDNCKLVS
ncbi:hypothetical protein L6E12_09760 [Actinokineospora sp. PR83]|uniref:hypothetical protein n=1 Tax=Actinokineospora sp. PR83 TaxID=2884908 RepID=UPI001F2EE06E|nr:hypothetical protein [Actinokineospora sp. PR83]MCG8916073.1 hypothetical protein [Actinokineospora sp. PR83]